MCRKSPFTAGTGTSKVLDKAQDAQSHFGLPCNANRTGVHHFEKHSCLEPRMRNWRSSGQTPMAHRLPTRPPPPGKKKAGGRAFVHACVRVRVVSVRACACVCVRVRARACLCRNVRNIHNLAFKSHATPPCVRDSHGLRPHVEHEAMRTFVCCDRQAKFKRKEPQNRLAIPLRSRGPKRNPTKKPAILRGRSF